MYIFPQLKDKKEDPKGWDSLEPLNSQTDLARTQDDQDGHTKAGTDQMQTQERRQGQPTQEARRRGGSRPHRNRRQL